jgi:glycosyltransferase involved in cell wall biosynthesis
LRDVRQSTVKRPALAFVGGYRHPPNVDAAKWAARSIMPLLREQLPEVELLLVGSHMPDEVAALAATDIVPVGYVPVLDSVFERIRLTIAPLRYGAGLKGKVLDSMAAGVPCVMTTIAAEGLNLPEELQSLVADEPRDFAERITALCRDERHYRRTVEAAQAYIAANYSSQRIDLLIRQACGLQ